MKLIITGDGTPEGTQIFTEDGLRVTNLRYYTHKATANPGDRKVVAGLVFSRNPVTPSALGQETARPQTAILPDDLRDDPITELEIHQRIPYPTVNFGIECYAPARAESHAI